MSGTRERSAWRAVSSRVASRSQQSRGHGGVPVQRAVKGVGLQHDPPGACAAYGGGRLLPLAEEQRLFIDVPGMPVGVVPVVDARQSGDQRGPPRETVPPPSGVIPADGLARYAPVVTAPVRAPLSEREQAAGGSALAEFADRGIGSAAVGDAVAEKDYIRIPIRRGRADPFCCAQNSRPCARCRTLPPRPGQ